MINRFFKRIFGSTDAQPQVEASAKVTYQNFEIVPAPVKESSGWRVSGKIVKEIEGVTREHEFIRADTCSDHESAVTLTVRKARQLIDERNEKIFD